MSEDPYPSPPPSPAKKIDPILRNALRYTISAKEYETIHQYLISRSPLAIQRRAPQPRVYSSIVRSNNNDFNAAAIRTSCRIFVATQLGLKIWDLITIYLLGKDRQQRLTSLMAAKQMMNLSLIFWTQEQTKDLAHQIAKFPALALPFCHSPSPPTSIPLSLPPPLQPSHQRCSPIPPSQSPYLALPHISPFPSNWRKSCRFCSRHLSRRSATTDTRHLRGHKGCGVFIQCARE